jgi:flagellar capping protein FliD
MSIFKQERENKRMIFNIDADLAERLDRLKEQAKSFEKRLDVDTAVNKALDKFIKKAEKKLEELKREDKDWKPRSAHESQDAGSDDSSEAGFCAPEAAGAPGVDNPYPAA